MLWSPPRSLTGELLIAWLAIGVFGLFTSASCFQIPHAALGAELSISSTDRTRLFGSAGAAGAVAAMVAMTLGMAALRTADAPREAAIWLFGCVAAAVWIVVPIAVWRLRESSQGQKAPRSPVTAYRDVWANPHARRLLLLNGIGALGSGGTVILAPFYMQYVVDAAHLTEVFIGLFFIPTLASIPIWVRLTRRFQKRRLWMASLGLGIPAWAGLFFVPEGSMATFLWLPALMGFAGGCAFAIPPAINAEVIDYDEYLTGERKEGSYSAAGALVGKAGGALMVAVAGAAIGWSGFVANAEQSESTRLVMRTLMCLPPIAGALAGMAILATFGLDERRVAEVRAELDRRATRV
jgi:GPH family glycoside/pentoside/hexuronide:cation symporter